MAEDINRLIGGMNSDVHPSLQPENTIREARNFVPMTEGGDIYSMTNESGTSLMNVTFPAGFRVIGYTILNTDVIVILAHPNGYSQVGYIVEDGNPDPTYGLYHPVAPYDELGDTVPENNTELGFTVTHPVDCVSRKLINGHRILYFTDNNIPFGQIDLDNPPIVGNASAESALIPTTTIPTLQVTTIIEPDASNIKPGVYQFITRYITDGGGTTVFGIPTNPVPMVPVQKTSGVNDYAGEYNENGTVGKSIQVDVSGIDDQFKELEIVVMYYEGNSSIFRAQVLEALPILEGTSTTSFTFNGLDTETSVEITREELEQSIISYTAAKCIEQKDNTLFLSNLSAVNSNTDLLQTIANDVTVGYNVLEFPFSNRGSNPDATIQFTLTGFPYVQDANTLILPFSQDVGAVTVADFDLQSAGTPATATIDVTAAGSIVPGDTITIATHDTQPEYILTAVAPGTVLEDEFIIGSTEEETANNIVDAIANSTNVSLFFVSDQNLGTITLGWAVIDATATSTVLPSGAGITTAPFAGGDETPTIDAPTSASVSGSLVTLVFTDILSPADELLINNDIESTAGLVFEASSIPLTISLTSPDQSGSAVAEGFTDYIDEINCVDSKGYRRGEIYSLGFVLVFKNGSTSTVFHIPGKADATFGLGRNEPNTPWTNFNTGNSSGELGTYISTSLYPTEQNYPADGPAGLENNTRHHYMPELHNEPHFRESGTSHVLRVLSLEFEFNTPIPASILENVQEILFVRENRETTGNKSVHAQGFVNRMVTMCDQYDSTNGFDGRPAGDIIDTSNNVANSEPAMGATTPDGIKANVMPFFDNLESIGYVDSGIGDGYGNANPERGFIYPGSPLVGGSILQDQGVFYSPETILDNFRFGESGAIGSQLTPELRLSGDQKTTLDGVRSEFGDIWNQDDHNYNKGQFLAGFAYYDMSLDYTSYVEDLFATGTKTLTEARYLNAGTSLGPISPSRVRTHNLYNVGGLEMEWTGGTLEANGAGMITANRSVPDIDDCPGGGFGVECTGAAYGGDISFDPIAERVLYNIRTVNTDQYGSIGTGKYLPIARKPVDVGGSFPTTYTSVFGGDTFISKFSYVTASVVHYWPYNQLRRNNEKQKHAPSYDGQAATPPSWRTTTIPNFLTINGDTLTYAPGWDLRGLNYYFVESSINTNYRHLGVKTDEETGEVTDDTNSYYPLSADKLTLLGTFAPWLDNPRDYNPQYSYDNVIKNYFPRSSTDNNITSFENRTIYSAVSANDDTLDTYREFPINHFYDLPANTGMIWDTFVSHNILYMHTPKSLWRTFGETAATLAGGNIQDVVLGTGSLFARPSYEMLTTEGGYAGTISQFGGIHAQIGYIFPDVLQGKVFGLVVGAKGGVSLQELSRDKISTFCHEEFPKDLILDAGGNPDLSNVTTANSHLIDNPYVGIGFSGGYDYKLRRAWLAKQGTSPFTLSYSTVTNAWASFHDYRPEVIIPYNNRAFFVKHDGVTSKMWEMNTGVKGDFFGTVYDSTIETVTKMKGPNPSSYSNMIIESESTNSANLLIRDDNFDTLQVYTDRQNTDVYSLIHGNTFDPVKATGETFIKYRNNAYRIAVPRDAVLDNAGDIFDPGNLDQSTATAERIKSDYAHNLFVYKNDTGNKFLLKSIASIITQNIR